VGDEHPTRERSTNPEETTLRREGGRRPDEPPKGPFGARWTRPAFFVGRSGRFVTLGMALAPMFR
jgi:hypothetical protein